MNTKPLNNVSLLYTVDLWLLYSASQKRLPFIFVNNAVKHQPILSDFVHKVLKKFDMYLQNCPPNCKMSPHYLFSDKSSWSFVAAAEQVLNGSPQVGFMFSLMKTGGRLMHGALWRCAVISVDFSDSIQKQLRSVRELRVLR